MTLVSPKFFSQYSKNKVRTRTLNNIQLNLNEIKTGWLGSLVVTTVLDCGDKVQECVSSVPACPLNKFAVLTPHLCPHIKGTIAAILF